MLTAQSQEATKVQALEDFADDYIVKPFVAKELVARIKRVLRRMEDFDYTMAMNAHYEVPFQFDFKNREINEGDTSISLTPTEAKLLFLLMDNDAKFVHMEILMNRIWPTKHVPEERLRVHVSRLRSKLQLLPSSKDYILTERGKGYRFQS
jgi:DNA-binding response OmpR family regulator